MPPGKHGDGSILKRQSAATACVTPAGVFNIFQTMPVHVFPLFLILSIPLAGPSMQISGKYPSAQKNF